MNIFIWKGQIILIITYCYTQLAIIGSSLNFAELPPSAKGIFKNVQNLFRNSILLLNTLKNIFLKKLFSNSIPQNSIAEDENLPPIKRSQRKSETMNPKPKQPHFEWFSVSFFFLIIKNRQRKSKRTETGRLMNKESARGWWARDDDPSHASL